MHRTFGHESRARSGLIAAAIAVVTATATAAAGAGPGTVPDPGDGEPRTGSAPEAVGAVGEPERGLPDRQRAAALAEREGCEKAPSADSGRVSEEIADRVVHRPGFALKVGNEVSPYGVTSLFVLPRSTLRLEAVLLEGNERFVAAAEKGRLVRVAPTTWTYRAPATPGVYGLTLCDMRGNRTMYVNVFVLEPYDGEDVFHGYRIGRYERIPLRDDPAYEMPDGFVRVTKDNEGTWVSPHFQLRQFLCKQESEYPKFLVLRTRLLIKLEMLLEALDAEGIRADGLHVMSGYRTPWYNRAIGNSTRYSRHAYGDAADVFVDNDRDACMDDITGDGEATEADARTLAAVIEARSEDAWYAPFAGGLGVYGPAPHRGPFIHIDTRGRRARW